MAGPAASSLPAPSTAASMPSDAATTIVRPLILPPPDLPPPPTPQDFQNGAEPASPAQGSTVARASLEQLQAGAKAQQVPAMEELARRLLQGDGVAKDTRAGAAWLARAAERGSAKAAFNLGVMYERGFAVERNPTEAVKWYREAAQAELPMARYNLALMLRDGRGVTRNGPLAVTLLRAASQQGMAAAMFALGDMYDRGEAIAKDQAAALAWFAITTEFDRQLSGTTESTLAKAAAERVRALRRLLPPSELDRARELGDSAFKHIVEGLKSARAAALGRSSAQPPAAAPATDPTPGPPSGQTADPAQSVEWPGTPEEQIRAVQRALLGLKLLHDEPDGVMGPITRAAIIAFQRRAGLTETGEPTQDVFAAMQAALAGRDLPPHHPAGEGSAPAHARSVEPSPKKAQ